MDAPRTDPSGHQIWVICPDRCRHRMAQIQSHNGSFFLGWSVHFCPFGSCCCARLAGQAGPKLTAAQPKRTEMISLDDRMDRSGGDTFSALQAEPPCPKGQIQKFQMW